MTQRQTPVDAVSGLPFLFVPRDEVLPLMGQKTDPDNVEADLNHAYHPRLNPALRGVDGGMAVRQCRVQFVMRADHEKYHQTFAGPPLPETRDERLRAVVLSAAGYIPPQALDFGGSRPRIVSLRREQRDRLQTSGEVRILDLQAVRSFLLNSVLCAEVGHIHPSTVDEFLSLTPRTPAEAQRRVHLAHLLLSLAIEPLVDPLDPAYCLGRKQKLIPRALPSNPRDFIHRQIVGKGRGSIHRVIPSLLAKFTGIAAEPAVA